MLIKLEIIGNLHVLSNQRKLFKEDHKKTIRDLNSQEMVKFNLPDKLISENETGLIRSCLN